MEFRNAPFVSLQTTDGAFCSRHFDVDRLDKGPKEIINPEIQKDLLVLEEQEVRHALTFEGKI